MKNRLFKGKIGHCIVCNALLAIHNEPCEYCHKPDELRCWKHHNDICNARIEQIKKDKYDLRYKYLGQRSDWNR